jgi:hypothetical protein
MKKILLVSLVMLLAVSVSFSQFGIKGGLSLAKAGGDNSKMIIDPSDIDPSLTGMAPFTLEPTNRTGFVAGISYKIDLILGLSIQPEALYIQKGTVYETPTMNLNAIYPGLSGSAKETMKMDYIEIPILVKYSLPIPVVSPYLEVGLSYGILIGAKQHTEVSLSGVAGAQAPSIPDQDIKDHMNKSDLSLQFGVGVSLTIVEIDVRYVLGLSKLAKDSDEKIYNRGIVLTAGLRL